MDAYPLCPSSPELTPLTCRPASKWGGLLCGMTQPTPPARNYTPALLVLVGVLVAGNVLMRRASTTDTPDAMPTVSAPAETRSPLTISGEGDGNTAPVDVAGGNYRVVAVTQKACFHDFTLRPVSGSGGTSLAVTSEIGTRENNIYQVEPGQYYVAATTGPACPWEITLIPQ